ncbi:MAG: hypothetical protein ACR2QM_00360 [Longimicrobiales bacterium]
MILHCSYEETKALTWGTELFLDQAPQSGSVLAPPREVAAVESLRDRISGEFSVETYHELQGLEAALDAVTGALARRMRSLIVATHPAGEEAVSAYFDYAHALSVLERARELKAEMSALIELMTGAPVDEESARRLSFPD